MLDLGLWARGWPETEWRWHSQAYLAQQLPQHRKVGRWDGSALEGRSLLVWSEGDVATVVKFARFLPLIRNAIVIVECDATIASWMSTISGVSQVISKGNPMAADLQIAIGSLPALLKCENGGEAIPGSGDVGLPEDEVMMDDRFWV